MKILKEGEKLNFKSPYVIIILTVVLVIILIFAEIEKRNHKKAIKRLNDLHIESQKQQIEKLREKFKYDLIGEWTSFEGTFSTMMNELWKFDADGKGKITSRSVMFGESVEHFKWRRKDLYFIEISYFDDDEEEEIWIEVRYDFVLTQSDCGDVISLVEVDKENNPEKGFGLMRVPLSFSGGFHFCSLAHYHLFFRVSFVLDALPFQLATYFQVLL